MLNMIKTRQIFKNIFRSVRIIKNFYIDNAKTKTYFPKIIKYTSLGLTLVHCEKLEHLSGINHDKLTHEDCIKQACMMTVNSATTLLSTVTSALLDIAMKYKNSLIKVLQLYEELLLTKGRNEEIWQNLVEYRDKVNNLKAALTEMNAYMSSVEKVINSTTEVAFSAGSEYLCTALCQSLYSAQTEITKSLTEIKKLEDDFLKLEEEVAKVAKSED